MGAKFIVDTKILFSALHSPDSLAGKIIDLAIEKKIELYAPDDVKVELTRNLRKKLDYNDEEIKFTLETLPINWLRNKLYTNFLRESQTNYFIERCLNPSSPIFYQVANHHR